MIRFFRLSHWISLKSFGIATAFGLCAYATMQAQLHIEIPGTGTLADPREIFVILAAAFTGPIGGAIAGILSSLTHPIPELRLYAITDHIINASILGWAYKKFVYQRLRMPELLLGWVGLVFFYYYISPTVLFLAAHFFQPSLGSFLVRGNLPVFQSILLLYEAWVPEFLITATFTTIVLVALPSKYRRPFWGRKIEPREYPAIKKLNVLYHIGIRIRNNFLGFRLAVWFLLFSILPLIGIGIFIQNNVSEELMKREAHHQLDLARTLAGHLSLVARNNVLRLVRKPAEETYQNYFVLDSRGTFVAHVDSSKIGSPSAGYFSEHTLERLHSDREGWVVDQAAGLSIGFAKTSNDSLIAVGVLDKSALARTMSDLEWLTYQRLGVTLFIISLACGIAIWIVVAQPIRQLTKAAEEIGRGNLHVHVSESEMDDEIRTLGRAFNEMTENVRQAHRGLENEVVERKLAEEALRSSEQRFSNLAEAAFEGIGFTESGKVTDANEQLCRMLGYTHSEIVGMNPIDLVAPESRHLVIKHIKSGYEVPYEHLTLRKDGSTFPVEVRGKMLNYKGRLVRVTAIRDITEQKKTEEALRQSEERYRQLIESARDVIFTLSLHGAITTLNQVFENITGFVRSEWLGKPFVELLHPDDVLKATDRFTDVFLGQSGSPIELRVRTKSGDYRVGEFTSTRLVKDGRPVGLFGIARDVTERKTLEERVRRSQQMESVGMLAGGIAHDFNNILGIILGYTSIMERSRGDARVLATSLETIVKTTLRGAALVKQLLTFARKSDILLQSVQVNHMVAEVVSIMKETFPKIIDVKINLRKDLPSIVADSTQIHQVLLNLCVNARDAMPRGGAISISTGVASAKDLPRNLNGKALEYVHIVLADTGHGMDEATKSRIFEPFFTTKEIGKGTGLGLATVYGIVEHHKGFIDVESAIEKGTTFHIYFPAQPQRIEDHERKKESAHHLKGGTETILVVEDEEMLLKMLKSMLMEKGYNVLTATNGEEGLRSYIGSQSDIAAVVSDVGLPKMMGSELFFKLRDVNPKVKVILSSGYIDPMLKSEMYKAGVKFIVQKPYDPAEIIQRIREAIDLA